MAIGYLRSANDRLEMDPDRRVREALGLAFRKFEEAGSVRQVALWLREERISYRPSHTARGQDDQWHLPRYNSVHRLLTNPVYAGAYVFGRTASQVRVEAGRKVVRQGVRRRQNEWEVLIHDHHAGYISWEQYERNQRLIGDNANMRGGMVPGSVRNGGGLLAGLLRLGIAGASSKSSIMAYGVSPATFATTHPPTTRAGRSASPSATCASTPRSQTRSFA